MTLKTQDFLLRQGTLEDLQTNLGIKHKRHSQYPNIVLLKYDMINSPMSNPIVQECRGLILDETDNWKVLCWSFKKFFNYGEGHVPKDFDFENFKTMDKLDGSLIQIYKYKAGWQIATSGTPDASGDVDQSGLTFKQLVLNTLTEMGHQPQEFFDSLYPTYSYAFELTAPENQIVVYHEKRNLTLLAARDIKTLEEKDIYHDTFCLHINPKVGYNDGFSMDAVQENVRTLDGSQSEGYVLMDKAFNRIKLKNDTYVLMSRGKDTFTKSPRACVKLIIAEGVDDVKHLLPTFVQERIVKYQEKVKKTAEEITETWNKYKHIEDQRDFALAVQHTKHAKAMFPMRKFGLKDGAEFIRWNCTDQHGDVQVSSKHMDWLGIFDKEEE